MLAAGWARDVVRAGPLAYVEGWSSPNKAALWAVDATGTLSSRAAPPGAPGNPALFNGSVYNLTFGDADNGLAITGVQADGRSAGNRAVYVTADGARTWSKVGLPPSAVPDDIAVGGGKEYVLASNCPTAYSACNHATVWIVDPTDPAHPRTFDNLPAPTDTTGPIAVAAYGDSLWVLLNMGAGRATPLHSSDGGRIWRPFDTGICLSEALEATSTDVLWATCGTGMLEYFARQADGPPVEVFPGDLAGTSSSSLEPFDDQTGYAILDHGGRRATIDATHDAGRTVQVVGSIPRPIDRSGFEATFVSPTDGFLVTMNGGQLYRTVDHGQAWTKIPAPSTDQSQ